MIVMAMVDAYDDDGCCNDANGDDDGGDDFDYNDDVDDGDDQLS